MKYWELSLIHISVLLAHHHQLVAEFQGAVGRGGEVDAASADTGDGAADVLHQVEVCLLYTSIPPVLFFKNGELVDKQVRSAPNSAYVAKIEAIL